MYKEVLSGIKDISIYPVFSFVIFFGFFSLMTFWLFKSRKKDFETISELPLSDNTPNN